MTWLGASVAVGKESRLASSLSANTPEQMITLRIKEGGIMASAKDRIKWHIGMCSAHATSLYRLYYGCFVCGRLPGEVNKDFKCPKCGR